MLFAEALEINLHKAKARRHQAVRLKTELESLEKEPEGKRNRCYKRMEHQARKALGLEPTDKVDWSSDAIDWEWLLDNILPILLMILSLFL